MNRALSDKIREYISLRLEEKLKVENKKFEKILQEPGVDLIKILADKEHKLNELRDQYRPAAWLTKAADRAEQITMATHVLKYIHSDAKGSSFYAFQDRNHIPYKNFYLSTSDIYSLEEDIVCNAAALDVGAILQIEANGKRLLDYIKDNDISPLACFTDDKSQLDGWLNGLKKVFKNKEKTSHTLAKQVYFPISHNQYHLISPLFPSSIAHDLYKRITNSRYSNEMKAAREAKKEGRYNPEIIRQFTNLAIQHFGGSKPQNISQLNSRRRGINYLFNAEPPFWHKRKIPLLNKPASFWQAYESRVWKTVKDLKSFLIEVKHQNSTISIRSKRQEFIEILIDELLLFAGEIINNKDPGWSRHSNLPIYEKLWLDPFNSDENFQQQRYVGDWKEKIYQNFAFWLNKKLEGEQLNMKDAEYKAWYSELKKEMNLLKDDLEAMTE